MKGSDWTSRCWWPQSEFAPASADPSVDPVATLFAERLFFFLSSVHVCLIASLAGQGKRLGHSRLRKSRNEAHLDKEMKFHLPELFALDAQLDVFSRQNGLHSGFFLRFGDLNCRFTNSPIC